jgi:glucokinase
MSYIGLDIGGTNVRYSFTDELSSNVLNCQKRSFVKTENPQLEVEQNICSIVDTTLGNVEGIGISLAAIMDRDTRKVKTWPNNPYWNHYDMMRHLRNRYNVPIIIEDDANCGAIGEYYSLSAPSKNMAYITIGTGIGCGLILNGSLFVGENGFAGELGHVWTAQDNNGSICSCGNKGCFQSMASGSAILKKYNIAAKTSVRSFEQVCERYTMGDPIAVQCLSNMITNISMVINNLAMCLDISFFVIGGGISNMGTVFISHIETKVNSRLKPFERSVSIKQARLGEFSGVYGVLQLLKNKLAPRKDDDDR